jgi:hypothetical protein
VVAAPSSLEFSIRCIRSRSWAVSVMTPASLRSNRSTTMASLGVEQAHTRVLEWVLRQTTPVCRSRTTIPAKPGRLSA